MPGKIQEIDTLKAISIVGVIFMHMEFVSRFSEQALSVIQAAQAYLGWCVLAFFFCSGMLIKQQEARLINLYPYAIKRAKRLLLPCLLFSVLYKFMMIAIAALKVFSWQANIPSSPYDFFEFIFAPIGPQFYFLVYLFWISISIILLLAITKTIFLVYGVILLVSMSFYLTNPPLLTPLGPGFNLIPAYALAFAWGTLLGLGKKYVKAFLSFLTVTLIILLCHVKQDYMLLYLLVPVCLFYLFKTIPWFNNFIEAIKLGEKSSAIYVWHAPLLLPFWSIVASRLVRIDLIEIPFIITMTVLSCYLISEVVAQTKFLKPLNF